MTLTLTSSDTHVTGRTVRRAFVGTVKVASALAGPSTTRLGREDERRLGSWTRFHSSCACRCVDVVRGLTKAIVPGDSEPLYYLDKFPCRRAEVVGLVIGVRTGDTTITYSIDDGTAILDCVLTVGSPHWSPAPSTWKGKQTVDPLLPTNPAFDHGDPLPPGTVVRVLGEIYEPFGQTERSLRIHAVDAVDRGGNARGIPRTDVTMCARLAEEALHAKKARLLRTTTYRQPLDVALTIRREQHEQAKSHAALTATEASNINAQLSAVWAQITRPPAKRARSPSLPSQRSLEPFSDLDFFLDDDATLRATLCVGSALRRPASASHATKRSSQRAKAEPRLHAPHRLSDDQLHVDTFTSYLHDYFRRHAGDVVTYRQLYTSHHFAPLARRLVHKLVAEGTATSESQMARETVSELSRLRRYHSEDKAVEYLYLRTLHQLRTSMYIVPCPESGDHYRFVSADTLGPSLLALLRDRARTPHELMQALRRGEARWQWARTERVHEILHDLAGQGAVKVVRNGRFAACA